MTSSLGNVLDVPGLFGNESVSRLSALSDKQSSSSPSSSRYTLNHDRSATDTLRFVLACSQSTLGLSHHDRRLIESFQAASNYDRAFVTSVAECSKQLQEWCDELDEWTWTGHFDDGGETQPFEHRDSAEKKEDDTLDWRDQPKVVVTVADTGIYGGYTSQQLATCRTRLQDIVAELENINMEDMKTRALTTRLNDHDTTYDVPQARLDILSALVTVALLEALPNYSRATSLTQMWAARIAVLELVPDFSVNVEQTKTALDTAWQSIDDRVESLSSVKFEQLRSNLEWMVGSLGRTIDFMLDSLEGLEDTVPEKWVDIVEALEVDYSAWCVAARRFLWTFSEESDSKNAVRQATESSRTEYHPQAEDIPASPSTPEHELRQPTEFLKSQDQEAEWYFLSGANRSPEVVVAAPSLTRTLSNASKLSTHRSLDSLRTRADEQRSKIEWLGIPRQAGHSRGPSIESVDSEIANPDGSHKSPVKRRLSVYRTASATSVGSITRSQIRSVDLTRNRGSMSFLNLDAVTREPIQADFSSKFADSSGDVDASDELVNSSLSEVAEDGGRLIRPQSAPITTLEHFEAEPLQQADEKQLEKSADQHDVNHDAYINLDTTEVADFSEIVSESTQTQTPDTSTSLQEPRSSPSTSREAVSTPQPARFSIHAVSTDEQLERRIDRILTTIPAKINFNRGNRTGDAQSQGRSSTEYAAASGRRTATPNFGRSPTPSLTLAPAEQREPRAPKSSGDSAIKVYHLYQEGRQHPIKLYVRLVGENGERVMVRVGGGWADLGEYLRDYASHHSRTVVPEPNVPLQAVDLHQPNNTRVFSLPTIANERGSPSPTPPDSPPDNKSWSGLNKSRTAPVPSDTLQVPQNRSRKSVKPDNSFQDMLQTKQLNGDASPSGAAGYPSSDAVAEEDGDDDEDSATAKLSPEKKRWLQGMVEKAKMWKAAGGGVFVEPGEAVDNHPASAQFEDMGSVGSTRRVYRVGDMTPRMSSTR